MDGEWKRHAVGGEFLDHRFQHELSACLHNTEVAVYLTLKKRGLQLLGGVRVPKIFCEWRRLDGEQYD